MSRSEILDSEKDLTIVIPSLGDDQLLKTIKIINQGSVVPKEIIVSLPLDKKNEMEHIQIENVKMIFSSKRGQVFQRSKGFKSVKTNLVMQLDDDIELDSFAIENMVELIISFGPGYVVGPSFYDIDTGKSLHEFERGVKGFLKSVNAFVFSSLWGENRVGKITNIGSVYGVDSSLFSNKEFLESSWLPGGCVLSHKSDLITEDFFPFSGKAYSEDVIHSLLRSSKNIRHLVSFKSEAKTGIDESGFSWKEFRSEVEIKMYIVDLLNTSRLRLLIWSYSQMIIKLFRL